MNEQSKTESPFLFNTQGQVLYCTRCDVFPTKYGQHTARRCLCSAVQVSLPFPDYWTWVAAEEAG